MAPPANGVAYTEEELIERALRELDGTLTPDPPKMSEEERRYQDLLDKKKRGEENVEKMCALSPKTPFLHFTPRLAPAV